MKTPATFHEFTDAVSAALPRLSPQQRVIAQHVLEHPDDFALGTAATVAEAAGVQPSALVRFANAMHFSGFSELQQLFRHRLLEQAGTYRQRISAMKSNGARREGQAAALHGFVEQGIAELQRLESSLADASLRQAARLLCDAERVHVLAQRRAFPVAAYLAYALGQLDLRVQLHDGVGGMLGESVRQIQRGEVLLVTSFKNYSPEVVDAAESVHARGVPVIAITDHTLSPLKPAASALLLTGSGTPAQVRSLVAPMCLAQALVVCTGQALVEPRHARGRRR
ncbi:MAG: MurR/RpiR family transcriptional regulator [Burkholderiaceae bacterium]|nr:MurR/RpiR family transcriptional regulator [Burkholderiaceae bacterium]